VSHQSAADQIDNRAFSYVAVLEYIGVGYAGWQAQTKGVSTISQAVKESFQVVLREKLFSLTGASRTDSGVNASHQVISFKTKNKIQNPQLVAYSVSALLRGRVAVRKIVESFPQFNPIRDAIWKRYRYRIYLDNNPPVHDLWRSWHLRAPLDLNRMAREIKKLIGKHDFTTFKSSDSKVTNCSRTILRADLELKLPLVELVIEGDGFLKQMVRNIVGSLVDIGRGRLKEGIDELLKKKERKLAGVTAPGRALELEWIQYPSHIVSKSY
jgi:tRNA pseudouridine38-40 synthase